MRHVLRASSTLRVLGCLWVLLAVGASSVRGQDITIVSAYVQYRTYETSTQNRFYAWVAFEKAGERIEEADLAVPFQEKETIWTESSNKFTPGEAVRMGERTGFYGAGQWIDEEWPFAESLLIAE